MVWPQGGELPVQPVTGTNTVLGGDRGDGRLSTDQAVHAFVAYEPVDGESPASDRDCVA